MQPLESGKSTIYSILQKSQYIVSYLDITEVLKGKKEFFFFISYVKDTNLYVIH